jgi:YVTN family beta-propeller protein
MPNGLIAAVAIAALCVIGSAAADTIYVSNEKDNTITVVDGASLVPVKTIPVGQRPRVRRTPIFLSGHSGRRTNVTRQLRAPLEPWKRHPTTCWQH